MKSILSLATLTALTLMAATPMMATAKTPAHKAHTTAVHKAEVSTTTVTPVSYTPCADTRWTTGNASSRQIKASPTPQFSCNSLRTVHGSDAATEADMRPPMSAKAAAAADTDDYIGMGTTVPPERK